MQKEQGTVSNEPLLQLSISFRTGAVVMRPFAFSLSIITYFASLWNNTLLEYLVIFHYSIFVIISHYLLDYTTPTTKHAGELSKIPI
jgi:hypothetical protein